MQIDKAMIKADGTKDNQLGANAILLFPSLAVAAAASLDIPLYRFLGGISGNRMPVLMMNIVNGGCYALSPDLTFRSSRSCGWCTCFPKSA